MQLLDLTADTDARGYHKRRKPVEVSTNMPRFLLTMSGYRPDALTLSYLFPRIQRARPTCVTGTICYPELVFHNYQFSRDLPIDRPGFTSISVEPFNEDVVNQAMK